VALPCFSMMVARPRHESTDIHIALVALVSTKICVEPTSYHAALLSPIVNGLAKGHAA
jgi:hypothetical protein